MDAGSEPEWISGLAFRRSEEHTSELQSPCNLVCRLLLEKKEETRPNGRRVTGVPDTRCRCRRAGAASRVARVRESGAAGPVFRRRGSVSFFFFFIEEPPPHRPPPPPRPPPSP